jgi:hypothetical protein
MQRPRNGRCAGEQGTQGSQLTFVGPGQGPWSDELAEPGKPTATHEPHFARSRPRCPAASECREANRDKRSHPFPFVRRYGQENIYLTSLTTTLSARGSYHRVETVGQYSLQDPPGPSRTPVVQLMSQNIHMLQTCERTTAFPGADSLVLSDFDSSQQMQTPIPPSSFV